MDVKRVLLATLAGAVTLFVLGFLVYALLLADFFTNNQMANVEKTNPNLPLIFVANLAQAFLFTFIFERWAGIKTFATGAKAGALIGLLIALFVDLIFLATTNLGTPTTTLVDIVAQTVMGAIAGGVIGLVLGKLADKA